MSTKKRSSDPTLVTLSLDKLRLDGGTQPRKELNPEVITEYAEAYRKGAELPPVKAFWDGESYWLVDGFHRVKALRRNHQAKTRVEVHDGTLNDAIWFAAGANRGHGLRRSNEDKMNAVLMAAAIAATMSPQPSSRQIAEHVGVDHKTVEKYRALGSSTGEVPQLDARAGRDGRRRKVQVGSKATTSSKSKESSDQESDPTNKGQEPSSAESPCAPVLDQVGHVISNPRIAAAFTRLRPCMDKTGDHLKAVEHEWKSFHDELVGDEEVGILRARAYADARECIEEKVTQLAYEFDSDAPYSLCPYCQGVSSQDDTAKRCRACGGGGWVEKAAYDRAPPEKKLALDQASSGASTGVGHA